MSATGKRKKKGKNPYPSNKKVKAERAKEIADNKAYWLFIVLLVLNGGYDLIFEAKTIGSDPRYLFYIVLLPTFLGIVLLAYYKRALIRALPAKKSVFLQLYYLLSYTVKALVISYISLGFLAKVTWNEFNKNHASTQKSEFFICDISQFKDYDQSRNAPKIRFHFQHEKESVDTDEHFIANYLNEDPKHYYLEVKAKKGLWNYYILEDWTVIAKD